MYPMHADDHESWFDSRLHPGLDGLLDAYRELDARIASACRTTGLSCPRGCTDCCQVPADQIEASPFEFIPLANALWAEGTALATLDLLASEPDRCVLIRNDRAEGGCGRYGFRPLLCRLFGQSLVEDPRKGPAFYGCRILKALVPEAGDDASLAAPGQASPDAGVLCEFPLAALWRQRIDSLDPDCGSRMTGINQALGEALRITGLRRRYQPERVVEPAELRREDDNRPERPAG